MRPTQITVGTRYVRFKEVISRRNRGQLEGGAEKQRGLDPVLMAATNSSGGVMGKMISPQDIATGVATTDLEGQEGVVFVRTFWHSVALTLVLGVLVFLQRHVLSWMIPAVPH